MPVRSFCLAVVTLLMIVTLAACGSGGGGPAQGAVQAVNIVALDIKWDKATLTARANQPIRVTMDNQGALDHDFVINIGGKEYTTGVKKSKEKGSVEFTAPAGTYDFWCAVPGHKEAGMVGKLTVQ